MGGNGDATTLATAEAGDGATTLALGEEGDDGGVVTIQAVGEEGDDPTTLATGEEGDDPTTLAIGEEGDDPTTLAVGEEGDDASTVVLIGKGTACSSWVDRKITWSAEKGPPNGLLGIRLSPSAEVPAQLVERGAEVLDWTVPADVAEFGPAIKRAAAAARGARSMPLASGGLCSR